MGQILMHEDCLDVAFEVYKSHRCKAGFVTMRGIWINLGYTGNPWPISTTETIVIKSEDLKRWRNITHSYLNVRTKS